MKINYTLPLILVISILSSCNKEVGNNEILQETVSTNSVVIVIDRIATSPDRILIDASKDGGVWWFPQGRTGYDITAYHQGQKLADYIRTQGFAVDEISIAAKVTPEVLGKYSRVIRAGAITSYTTDEIAAYEAFLDRGGSLLLAQDHLGNFPNDMLSKSLGVEFAGVGGSAITGLSQHAITAGVSSIPYMVGSGIANTDKSKMTILGTLGAEDYIDVNKNNTKDPADIVAAPVMGILHHPKSKIFFIGDVNGIEQVPQPFTQNLVKWLFR